MTCGRSCPYAWLGHTDAARRMSDAATLAWEADGWDVVGKWMAFALADGSTDHTVYPTKKDAVRHQSDEFRCAYITLHPGGMSVCEAEIMLVFHRKAYDAGFRLADPDHAKGGPDIIPRIGNREITKQIISLEGG